MNELVNTQAQVLAAKLSVSELSINDLDSQIKALQFRKKSMTAEIDDFKNDLRQSMTEHGVTRIESKEYGIMFRLDKPSVVLKVIDENLIDDKYFKTVKQLDKLAVKKALQVGDSVQGAELSEGKHKLTVKV